MNENYSSFDKAFDMLLTEAAVKADENIGWNLNEPAEKPEFSAEHEQRMARLFEHERRKLLRRKIIKYSSRCACVLFAAVIVAAAGIFGVDAWRASFLNFMSGVQEENADYNFDSRNENTFSNDKLTLMYIPDGFSVTKNIKNGEIIFLKFENKDKYFSIAITNNNGNFSNDTEGTYSENVTVKNQDAFFTEKGDEKNLIWGDKNYSYIICGNIDKKEMIKIAENMENNENFVE